MIPRTLFQTDKRLDPELEARWRRDSPSFQYVFMDDAAARQYLQERWGEDFVRAFDTAVIGALKADFLRLCYLADRGGFYIDTDMVPCQPGSLETLLQTAQRQQCGMILCREASGRGVYNALMACTPQNCEMSAVARQARDNILERVCESGLGCFKKIAGPHLLNIAFFGTMGWKKVSRQAQQPSVCVAHTVGSQRVLMLSERKVPDNENPRTGPYKPLLDLAICCGDRPICRRDNHNIGPDYWWVKSLLGNTYKDSNSARIKRQLFFVILIGLGLVVVLLVVKRFSKLKS